MSVTPLARKFRKARLRPRGGAEAGKPNVVLILTDDQGYQDLGEIDWSVGRILDTLEAHGLSEARNHRPAAFVENPQPLSR